MKFKASMKMQRPASFTAVNVMTYVIVAVRTHKPMNPRQKR